MQKIEIIGNLTRDPESRVTQSGVNVCSFSVAVNGKRREDETLYFRVTTWRKLAEICSQYCTRGKKVYVCGTIDKPKPYTNNKGEVKCDLCITADDVEFLSKGDDNSSSSHNDNNGYVSDPEPSYNKPQETYDTQNGFTAVETDELPFDRRVSLPVTKRRILFLGDYHEQRYSKAC